MKKFWIYNSAILLITCFVLLACSEREQRSDQHYICPMHPSVVSEKPSTCPVCGMDLVRQLQQSQEITLSGDVVQVLQSPASYVIADVPTVKPEYKQEESSLILEGRVVEDPNDEFIISAKVSGRIEYVGVSTPYEWVKRGQLLMRIYSPELVVAQREFLMVLSQGHTDLIEASKRKLLVLGATEHDVQRLMNDQIVQTAFPVYAPQDGYILIDQQELTSSKAFKSDPMAGMDNNTARVKREPLKFLPKVGSIVQTGDVLFSFTKQNHKRAEFYILNSKHSRLQVGDTLLLSNKNHKNVISLVTEIIPSFTEYNDYSIVRSALPTEFQPVIGEVIHATSTMGFDGTFWLPRTAVFDKGLQHIVWKKEGGGLVPSPVMVGERLGDHIQILSGLSSSSEVAKQAHFLVDSETIIGNL
jgi:Cu(I)/Ag(I) efflux system membrane fusion protein